MYNVSFLYKLSSFPRESSEGCTRHHLYPGQTRTNLLALIPRVCILPYINGTSEGHITVKDLDACFINDFRASEWAPQTNFSSCLLCKLMVNPSALDVSFLDCMWLQKKYLRDGIAPGIVYLSPPLLKPSTQNTSPTLPVAVGADIREDASVPVSAVYSLAVISPNGRQILMFYSNLIANHSRQIALPTELSGISSLWYC
jgi:hypothetical protein